ncbi:MAG: GNAT family N-acetyltransferase [Candidatus Velthaea sp.]
MIPVSVRPLRDDDVPAMAAVLERAYAAGQDFRVRLTSYLAMPSARTFVAESSGGPAGMVVGNDYGPCAYVALMGVDPDLQRQGVGTALMDAVVAWIDQRGFAWAELDATPDGAPLYIRYGFGDHGETLVNQIQHHGDFGNPSRAFAEADRRALLECDAQAFGGDRKDVLAQLLENRRNCCFVEGADGRVDGYAVAQPGAGLIGPVIARDRAVAARLIASAHAVMRGRHRINVPSDNPDAAAILAQHGFGLARSLRHMVRGRRIAAARERIFARVNLGQG